MKNCLRPFAFLLFSITILGQGNGPVVSSPGDAAFLRGRELVQAKNYTGAMAELKEALRLDPRHALAFYYVGVAQFQLKEYVVANAAFERALQLNVLISHHNVYRWIGDCQKALNDYDRALSAYRESVRVKPDYAEGFNQMGLIFYLKKDFPNAGLFFEQAARLDPTTPIYRKNVGMAHIGAGKKDEAMKVYNALVRVDAKLARELLDSITKPATAASTTPRTPAQLQLDEGYKFYDAKDYAKALASFQEALRLDPASGEAAHRIGMCRNQLKQYPEAIAAFENAVKLKYAYPHFSYDWIGDTHYTLKQYDKAVVAFTEARRLKPDYEQAVQKLGNSHYRLKQYSEALAAYQSAIKLKPDNAVLHASAGDAYSALAQHDKALTSYSEAARLDPKYDWALNMLAVSHFHLKQYAAALPAIEQALRLKPDDALYLTNHGDVLFQLGRKAEALAVQKRLATIDKVKADELLARINTPPGVDAAVAEATKYFKARDYPNVITEAQKILALKPNAEYLALAHSFMGSSYSSLRQYDKAIISLTEAIKLRPDDSLFHWDLGYAYLKTLQFARAAAAFKEAVRLKPDDNASWRDLGFSYAMLGRKPEAMRAYNELLKLDKDQAEGLLEDINRPGGAAATHIYFGDMNSFLGNKPTALEYYQNALKLNPTAGDLLRIGNGFADLGEYEQGIAAYRKIIAGKPTAHDHAYALASIGDAYVDLTQYDKALAELKEANRIKPLQYSNYAMGMAFSGLKQYPEALAAFEQANKLSPTSGGHLRIAEIHNTLKQHDKALVAAKEAARLDPKSAVAMTEVGFSYFMLKQYEEALAAFTEAIKQDPKFALAHLLMGHTYRVTGRRGPALGKVTDLRPLDPKMAKDLFDAISRPAN